MRVVKLKVDGDLSLQQHPLGLAHFIHQFHLCSTLTYDLYCVVLVGQFVKGFANDTERACA